MRKAKKLVEWREPEPNTHEWKYVGRTPQGGLAGGDDIYECKLCGKTSLGEEWNGHCWEAKEKGGKTEAVQLGWKDGYPGEERAVLGKHIIVKDVDGIHIVEKEVFEQNYEIEEVVQT